MGWSCLVDLRGRQNKMFCTTQRNVDLITLTDLHAMTQYHALLHHAIPQFVTQTQPRSQGSDWERTLRTRSLWDRSPSDSRNDFEYRASRLVLLEYYVAILPFITYWILSLPVGTQRNTTPIKTTAVRRTITSNFRHFILTVCLPSFLKEVRRFNRPHSLWHYKYRTTCLTYAPLNPPLPHCNHWMSWPDRFRDSWKELVDPA